MRRTTVLLVVLCSVLAACGSRRTTADFEAAELAQSTTETQVVDGDLLVEDGDASSAVNPTESGTVDVVDGNTGPDDGASGDGDPAGDGGDADDGSQAPVVPGSPVIIGFVGTLSGPAGVNIAPIRDGLQVWVKYVNDRGGVNGHPVQLVVADDRGDSARHRSLVQQLVEEKGVMAFVGNADVLLGPVSVSYLAEAGVPRIGGDTGGDWMYSDPLVFPQASSGLALIQAGFASVAERAVADGQERIAVFSCQEAQVCRDGARMYPTLASTYGVKIVYQATTSIAKPDFTAECLNAQKAKAEVVIVSLDANSINRVAASCARQGFHPTYAWNASLTVDSHKDNPDLQGALVAMNVAPWTDASTPALKDFRDAMAAYAPMTPPNAGHITGWTSGILFGRGAARLPEPPTSAGIVDGLFEINDDDLGGLTYPITFTRGQSAPRVVCWFGVRIVEEAFVADNEGQRSCDSYRG